MSYVLTRRCILTLMGGALPAARGAAGGTSPGSTNK